MTIWIRKTVSAAKVQRAIETPYFTCRCGELHWYDIPWDEYVCELRREERRREVTTGALRT